MFVIFKKFQLTEVIFFISFISLFIQNFGLLVMREDSRALFIAIH